MSYTDKEAEEMYLEWFNNYLTTQKFAEHYNLSISDTENILDRGRKLNKPFAIANTNQHR